MEKYLYIKIYNDLKEDIISGVLKNGNRLPTEKDLTEKYNVSRITAIKAMQKLENKGYIKRIRGNGSFVIYNNIATYRDQKISVNLKSKNIAFMAKCSTDIFIYILSNLQKVAISNGYNVSIFDTTADNISEAEILNSISKGGFCGIICQPSFVYDNLPEFVNIMNKNIPIIFVDGSVPMLKVPVVKSNNYLGGYKITKLLIESGHKNIGMVFSDLSNFNEQERFSGYLYALKEYNIDFDLKKIYTFDKFTTPNVGNNSLWNSENKTLSVREDVKEILNAPDCPTAFFCVYDRLAVLLEQYAIELGYKVPDDISIVGYNNAMICDSVITPITSVDQNYRAIAEQVFTLLTNMIKGENVPYENLIEPMIFERDSVKILKEN